MKLRSLILLSCTLLYIVNAVSQENDTTVIEKTNSILRLAVIKNSDDTRTLTGTLTYRDKDTREIKPIQQASLNFYTGLDSMANLGKLITDEKGIAKCIVPADFKYLRNEEGLIRFSVSFDGNELFESNDTEAEVVDIQIKISIEVLDSVKTVTVEAYKILGGNITEPLTEESIAICVGRMFSHLKLGEIELADGTGTFEFPSDIPGDSMGILKVIAKFDEHESYATVVKSENATWGTPTSHHTV